MIVLIDDVSLTSCSYFNQHF